MSKGGYVINKDKANQAFVNTKGTQNIVTQQSIPVGTVIPQGTVIDLTFSPGGQIVASALDNGLKYYDNSKMIDIYGPYANRADIKQILEKDYTDLSPDDKVKLNDYAASQHIPLTGQPGSDTEALFNSMAAANQLVGASTGLQIIADRSAGSSVLDAGVFNAGGLAGGIGFNVGG